MKKIYRIDNLIKKTNKEKTLGHKIVHCHGVFDLVHIGHIKHFREAKKNGDYLIVSITSDKFVNKGSGRPIFNENFRAEFIASLEFVNAVYINDEQTPEKLISLIKPNIYFKGPDYKKTKEDRTRNILKEIRVVKKFGGKVAFSNDITFSSSSLINNYFDSFNTFQKKYLSNVSKKYGYEFIEKKINSLKNFKVLLIGETIIDQYIFGNTLGKSGKEPHLVLHEERKENYLGGASAIANHLSGFCKKVEFLSVVGSSKENISFVKKSLAKNVNPKFLLKKNSPTILKKRFIDNVTKHKLLGVYSMNDAKLDDDLEKKLISYIKKISKKCDLILVSDYGHGFISEKVAKIISSMNKSFSLNAQVNASNYGYHSLRKYKKIDNLIINESELRHEMRDKISNSEVLALQMIKDLKINNLIITRGKNGAIFLKKNSKPIYCPAFANKVIDKIGAGDSMLSIIALCMKIKLPNDLALFLGSLAGATAVENIGNSKSINKQELLRQVQFSIK